jgi:DUF4097 and DUF4098 domain-containing protein YvlB
MWQIKFQAAQESLMSETLEKTFKVVSPAHLNLSNIRGSVDIHPGEEGIIHVMATKEAGSGDAKQTEIELSQEADGTVKVATHFPEWAWGWLFGSRPCRVNYVVKVPRSCSLKVNGVSCEILAEGFEGEFAFKSVSGGITLRSLSGPLQVNSVSGDLQLDELNGSLNLKTVSGNLTGKHIQGHVQLDTVSGKISMDESNLNSVTASTVSGGMRYQTALGEGPYNFNAVSGDVELLVPPETRCSAELRAISGRLTTQIPTTSISRQNGSQTAEIQGGGVKVLLRSISGNLVLA